MNILHINNFSKDGGAETVFNLTRSIDLDDIVNYSGFVGKSKTNEEADIGFFSWENDNKFLGVFNYIFSFKNYSLLLNYLKNNHIDIIHIHGFFSSLSPSILLAIKKIKKNKSLKVIQTLHDFHLICPNSSLFNFKKNEICEKCIGKRYKWFIFKDRCDRRGLWHSIIKSKRSFVSNNLLNHKNVIDQFIAPSEFLRNKMIEDHIPKEKISIVRNPVIFSKDELHYKKENLICFFGRFTREKNIPFLLKAFTYWKKKNNNDFKLLLIGNGEDEILIKNIAENSEFKNSISIKEFMQKEKLIDEIRNAKYFSMTSKWYENAPMTIWESISLNIIPVVPNFGGMKESIEITKGIGRTYISNSIKSWSDTIDELENNYLNEYENLIKLKNEILIKYSLENYLLSIKEVYENQLTNT